MRKYMKVSILVDSQDSWFNLYLDRLFSVVRKYDQNFYFTRHAKKLRRGDILFILSCVRLLTRKELSLHKNNIVVHASDLPKGRGWSPWTWQIESGKNIIPLTLFEASESCDSGNYYLKSRVRFDGTELIEKIRRKIAGEIIDMIRKYLSKHPFMAARPQKGKATYFPKRKASDNELDIARSISSQFNKIRVSDNERYPLHFKYKGRKYILKSYNCEDNIHSFTTSKNKNKLQKVL